MSGASFFTAGLILAIMITPIVTSLRREVIATVPREREGGAYALGATRWEMIRGAVLPHSQARRRRRGLLGLGRAMGETIAVALVIGSSATITTHLLHPRLLHASSDREPVRRGHGRVFRAALIGMGVLLFALTIIINLRARAHRGPLRRRRTGGMMASSLPEPQTVDLARAKRLAARQEPVATGACGSRSCSSLVPLGLRPLHRDLQGRSAISWQFLTDDIPPNVPAANGRRHGAGHRRHAAHHRLRRAHGHPARHPRRASTSTSTAQPGAGAVIRFFADVMTGVPSIMMGLFIYTHLGARPGFGTRAIRRRPRPRLPDAAHRDPHHRRDAPPGPDEPPRGELRARRHRAGGLLTVVLPAARPRHHHRRHCSPSRAPRARLRRCSSPSLGNAMSINTDLFTAPNSSLPRRSSRTRTQPYVGAQDRAWGSALDADRHRHSS